MDARASRVAGDEDGQVADQLNPADMGVFADRLPQAPPERRRALAALHAATDVYTWKLLRRDLGLGRRTAQQVMTEMVEAIASAWPTDDGARG